MGLALVIDVLLAAYNGAAFLPRQAASLAGQLGEKFRVVIQDDGSTDDTPALIASLCAEDARFATGAESGRHLGAIGNFLSLMRQSDAPYCALCDQDDEWAPDRLLACMAAMRRAEETYGADVPLLVHSDAHLIDEHGAEIAPSFFARQGWDGDANTLARLLVQNNVTGCTALMNAPLRRLVTAHGQAQTMFMHDWFIALTAAAFGHIMFVPQPLVGYRQHGGNVMGASADGLMGRAAKALSMPAKGRERIALTYRHARAFREAYGSELPADMQAVVDGYLATERMPKLLRVWAVQRGGYTMQSRVTRAGQILFG